MRSKHFFENLLVFLRAKPRIHGLEISDSSMRFARSEGPRWQLTALRVPPGVLEGGKIKDRGQFLGVLLKLREQVSGKRKRRPMSVSVSLSSANVYTQLFSLPLLKGDNFEKAVELNVQMVSPTNLSDSYSSWQVIDEDKQGLKYEILSAFLNRALVDEMVGALSEAGFTVVSVESRALSLGRLIRTLGAGFSDQAAFAVLHLDNDALDLMIVRKGKVYFDYFSFWSDLNAEGRHIRVADFEAAITRNLHQMITFYNQHWQEPVSDIFVITLGLRDEVSKIIRDNFQLEVKELTLNLAQPAGPEWFVALGAGLRGLIPRSDDRDISLTEVGTQEEFRREQVLVFLAFWRVAVPVVAGLLLAVLFGANLFLKNVRAELESQSLFSISSEKSREIEELRAKAARFNLAVQRITDIKQSLVPRYPLIQKLVNLAQANGVSIRAFRFDGIGSETAISGVAGSDEGIRRFKNALDADRQFGDVKLPLVLNAGKSSGEFTITFSITSLNATSSPP